MVKKAIVLAAGYGKRLRPLTSTIPKPLMPVWGEKMLSRIVDMLRSWGVEDIVVNTHYLHEQVEAWAKENDCRVSYEPRILGTGGAINPLRNWLGEEDFYLVNSDIVVEGATKLDFRGDELGVAYVSDEGPRTIEVECESRFVTCWNSPDPGWGDTYTYAGITLLRNRILKYLKSEGEFSIINAYEKAMMEGDFIRAVRKDDFLWSDAGTIDSLIALNQDGEDNAFDEFPHLKAVGATAAKFIGARGSERVFFKAKEGVVVIYDDTNRKENGKYSRHAKWLKAHGVKVPEVIAESEELKALLLEDVGKENLAFEKCIPIIEALHEFSKLTQAESELDLESPMDEKMWEWERELFKKHCLEERYGLEMSAEVEKELEKVAEVLNKEPKALVHRDFQSTNVLWRGENFAFIDFQGMRMGPAIYDLASFVYDPYRSFTDKERYALISLYAKVSSREEVNNSVHYAAVERLVQCLGAYGRLTGLGKSEFKKFFKPALENLLVAADKLDLDNLTVLAEDLLGRETEGK